MLSSPSPASCRLINHHAFFTDSTKRTPMLCVFITKRAPSGIRLGDTRPSFLMILLTSAFWCVLCSLITLPNSDCACVRNVFWIKTVPIGWIHESRSVGLPPPWPVAWLSWPSSAAPSFDAYVLQQSPALDCFGQNFPKVSVDMTTNPTCCPLLALYVRTPLC